ncbi:uncharacterized protein E0L32_002188 [Thyridium curvatum]|uniref:Uncharacterized protein n=1 Tax=Thyridium curvatum TaxID=1093900 RepID=A0A507AED2_9PEZI|nr:uncharacterized protein E0L32_002188 [Thyridium curvatum]TPX06692.1 hypothetical protein E0L32_002188 [Thyridium curvatum]
MQAIAAPRFLLLAVILLTWSITANAAAAAGLAPRIPEPLTMVAADGKLFTDPAADSGAAKPTTLQPPSAPFEAAAASRETEAPPPSGPADPTAAGPPPADPAITPAPATVDMLDQAGNNFIQTTYYTCVTVGSYSHCGWHEPILDASSGADAGQVCVWHKAALAVIATVVIIAFDIMR